MVFLESISIAPIQPRALRGQLLYPDLLKIHLEGSEKQYFIESVVPNLTLDNRRTFKGACSLFNPNVSTCWNRLKSLVDGKTLQSSAEKPLSFPTDAVKKSLDVFIDAESHCNPLNEEEKVDLIISTAKAYSEDRKIVDKNISPPTMSKTLEKLKSNRRKAQKITNARFVVCLDPAMSYFT